MTPKDELNNRRDALIAERLQIQLQQRKDTKQFHEERISTPKILMAQREARIAEINLEIHQVEVEIRIARSDERAERRKTAHRILVSLVTEAGMEHLVHESERLALEGGAA